MPAWRKCFRWQYCRPNGRSVLALHRRLRPRVGRNREPTFLVATGPKAPVVWPLQHGRSIFCIVGNDCALQEFPPRTTLTVPFSTNTEGQLVRIEGLDREEGLGKHNEPT